ncbi:hypothetical protein BT93_K0575 [Corymbia citriodora subsp. variegata]|nr:hypothetical protein BT93_K0575 [Corymbia citriodora subsp. variegata]
MEVLAGTEALDSKVNRGFREKKAHVSSLASHKCLLYLNEGSLEKTIRLYLEEFVLPGYSSYRHGTLGGFSILQWPLVTFLSCYEKSSEFSISSIPPWIRVIYQ